ncbi:zinc ribbon domain-containing protein [Clostridium beijerinckii]|uniref:Aspartokinase n=1 Tax=Clostridium beijerinckii TaxID=1520 RepID=A0AAE5H0T4_CLOBE|nr:zinc ribbon domain-containing protein [Clostridium beijerinckii]NSB12093.1 aspartokinase [Clostridium beijerinckii]OOM27427.1 hypothetical protein CLOBE_29850 [Clostridium beijerinckii]
MKCNKCGYENKEDAKFCNQCGGELVNYAIEDVNKNNDDTTIISEKTEQECNIVTEITGNKNKTRISFINKICNLSAKKQIGIYVLIVVLLFGGASVWNWHKNYQYETGNGLSYDEKKINLSVELISEKYDKARELSKSYKVHDNDIDKIIQIYKDNKGKVYTLNDAEQILSKQQYTQACTVEKVEIKNKSYSSKYVDVEITVKNNTNQNINYVKVGLDFSKSEQIVKSDWTNDNSTIKPNATQKLTKMIDHSGWDKVHAEVTQWEK